MKTKFSMFVVVCLLLTLFTGCLTGFAADMPEVEQMYSYDDVKEGHWSYPWVTYMTNHNYIHGYPAEENDGLYLYKPDQFITRGEFVTILYFMLRPQGHMTETFTDITTKHWSYPYVDKAVANGYMSGYGDGTVRPDDFITREEASSVVYRAFKIQKYTNETDFVDKNNISSWAYEAIMSLADLGIIVGYTGEEENSSYVQPKVNIKRAEVAALLANADKFYPASVNFSDETVTYTVAAGGKLAFDMFPKNTTDSLSVAIDVEPDTVYTVSYNINGEKKTVTAAEFADMVFTSEELENLGVILNFPDAKAGDKLTATVSVTDKGGAIDRVVGSTVYNIEFGYKPLQGGGTPSVVKYTVTYIIGTNEPLTEEVVSGSKPVNVPTPDSEPTKNYEWRDGVTNEVVIPGNVEITSNRTFVTDGTMVDRDRVVESLQAYQRMKNQGEGVATISALTNDVPNDTITPGATNGTEWWTNDMLQVIVTNDRNFHLVNIANNGDIVNGKTLKPIYDDVARYVVDHYDYFTSQTITSENKAEFVGFFRAMIGTIERAADAAVEAYVNARKNNVDADPDNNQYKDKAFRDFLAAATDEGGSSLIEALTEEWPTVTAEQKTSLSIHAAAYVKEMVENMAPDGTADGAKLNAGLAVIKEILEGIYGPTFNFDDAGACTAAAVNVKNQIAQKSIYAK